MFICRASLECLSRASRALGLIEVEGKKDGRGGRKAGGGGGGGGGKMEKTAEV